MATPLKPPALQALHPFQSFWIFQTHEGIPASGILPMLRRGIAELLKDDSQDSTFGKGEDDGELETEFLVYERRKPASWTDDERFVSAVHHLCLISARGALICIFNSEDRLGGLLESAVAEGQPEVFGSLRRVPPNILNEAFVKGDAKTLWLKGTHRSTSLKPDRKVIVGRALQEALEPLGDQSYAFTAARCKHQETDKVMGVSPASSSVWIGPSRAWADYKGVVTACCDSIAAAAVGGGNASPLPVLASRTEVDFSRWGDVLELSVMTDSIPEAPTEHGGKVGEGPPFSAFFDIIQATPPSLVADVHDDAGEPQGRFKLSLQKMSNDGVGWTVEAGDHRATSGLMLDRLRAARGNLQAWFENGFHVSGAAAYEVKFRDVPFRGFEWHVFAPFKICVEKPKSISHKTIGLNDSLFCWFQKNWAAGGLASISKTGWLACNDGSMEMADFIHLSDEAEPTLTMVHIKRANAAGNKRNLSVTAHEVVVSQAVKNLRFLDSSNIATEFGLGLLQGLQKAVWRNGLLAERNEMVKALDAVGTGVKRRVVIVQPHTRKSIWVAAADQSAPWAARRRRQQLATLLNGVQQTCAGLGAEFVVMADDS